jgi:hypothetical protein
VSWIKIQYETISRVAAPSHQRVDPSGVAHIGRGGEVCGMKDVSRMRELLRMGSYLE